MRLRIACLAACLLALVAAAPVSAVSGWVGPTRVVASVSPLSPSTAMDADGKVHVAWLEDYDAPSGIFYATNAGGTWHSERVTTGETFYAQPDLALDDAGYAYIAFARLTCPDEECTDGTSRIYIATNKSGHWKVHPRTAGPADLGPSLVVRDGALHVAFQRRTYPDFIGDKDAGVWYATNQSGSWTEQHVSSAKDSCPGDQFPSLGLDAAGHAFVTYEALHPHGTDCLAGYSEGLRLATDKTGAWVRSTVTTNKQDFGSTLAMGTDGKPRIVFDRAGTGVEFSRYTGSAWTAPSLIGDGESADLALDADNGPRVAWEDTGIWYAARSGGGPWVKKHLYTGPVDEGTYSGPSVVVGSAGKARVVFTRTDAASEDDLGVYYLRQQ